MSIRIQLKALSSFSRRYSVLGLVFILSGCIGLETMSLDQERADPNRILAASLALVTSQLDKGESNQAWLSLKPLLDSYKEHPDVLNLAGLCHLALSNHQRALEYFRQAYKLEPKAAYGLNLGSVYLSLKQPEKARQVFLNLKKEHLDYPHPERLEHNLALSYHHQGLYDEAKRYYEKALAIDPGHYVSHLELARLYDLIKDTKESRHHYLQAKRICRMCYPPVEGLVTLDLASGESKKAKIKLEHFLKEDQTLVQDQNEARNLLGIISKQKIVKNIDMSGAIKKP